MTGSLRWRKASKSQTGSSCVELAHTLDAIRDSKNGDTLTVPNLAALIAVLKAR